MKTYSVVIDESREIIFQHGIQPDINVIVLEIKTYGIDTGGIRLLELLDEHDEYCDSWYRADIDTPDCCSLSGFVRDIACCDSVFELYDDDAQESLYVKGWAVEIY